MLLPRLAESRAPHMLCRCSLHPRFCPLYRRESEQRLISSRGDVRTSVMCFVRLVDRLRRGMSCWTGRTVGNAGWRSTCPFYKPWYMRQYLYIFQQESPCPVPRCVSSKRSDLLSQTSRPCPRTPRLQRSKHLARPSKQSTVLPCWLAMLNVASHRQSPSIDRTLLAPETPPRRPQTFAFPSSSSR